MEYDDKSIIGRCYVALSEVDYDLKQWNYIFARDSIWLESHRFDNWLNERLYRWGFKIYVMQNDRFGQPEISLHDMARYAHIHDDKGNCAKNRNGPRCPSPIVQNITGA
jgi:hypothetical protein